MHCRLRRGGYRLLICTNPETLRQMPRHVTRRRGRCAPTPHKFIEFSCSFWRATDSIGGNIRLARNSVLVRGVATLSNAGVQASRDWRSERRCCADCSGGGDSQYHHAEGAAADLLIADLTRQSPVADSPVAGTELEIRSAETGDLRTCALHFHQKVIRHCFRVRVSTGVI